jgi:hypothetical protein
VLHLPFLEHLHGLLFVVAKLFLPTVVLEHILGNGFVVYSVVPASSDEDVSLEHGTDLLFEVLVVILVVGSTLSLACFHLLEVILVFFL